jgi:phosphatidylglycerol---prolipoprotein diacylglyceryl transferase
MHPILFRIPLPKTPLKLWWGLAVVIAIALVYAIIGLRKKERSTAGIAAVVAIGAGVIAKTYAHVDFKAENLPIYSYGVMLGLSLVVGWYLTLTLAARDGLPKETMANCYVITAIAAIVGSRILYILTNVDEFRVNPHDANTAVDFASFFALRRGGLVDSSAAISAAGRICERTTSGSCLGRTSRSRASRPVCWSRASAATCSAATSVAS